MRELRERQRINGTSLWDAQCKLEWKVDCLMFVDDTALVYASEEELQELARVFSYV